MNGCPRATALVAHRLGATVAVAALALVARACSASEPGEAAPGDIGDSVHLVRTTACDGGTQQRAVAVAVSESLLATVAHVFGDTSGFEVELADRTSSDPDGGELVWLDAERDLALIAVPNPLAAWFELGEASDGDAVSLVTLDEREPVVRPARILRQVTATLDGVGERHALELEATIDPGDSGSPVIGADGSLVGVVFATTRGDQRGWAIAADEIVLAVAAVEGDGDEPVTLSCS